MEEKKQKKIKASGTPAKFSWYFKTSRTPAKLAWYFKTSRTPAKLAWYQTKFPAPEGAVRDANQVDYRTILATISLSSVRKAEAS